MPITLGVDREHPLVTTTVRGHVTYEEIQSRLSEEEHLRATGYPELIDAMGASTAIASDNNVVYGMARMYQILAERDGISIGVFRSVADAERWLRAD